MMEKDYRKEGEKMEKIKNKKYSRTDSVILGIGDYEEKSVNNNLL